MKLAPDCTIIGLVSPVGSFLTFTWYNPDSMAGTVKVISSADSADGLTKYYFLVAKFFTTIVDPDKRLIPVRITSSPSTIQFFELVFK